MVGRSARRQSVLGEDASMTTYTFSWYSLDFVTKILRPKWWQVWKRATLYRELQWVRHCITDIPEDEGKLLLEMFSNYFPMNASANTRLIVRFMGQRIERVQLEKDPGWQPYVSTGKLGEPYKGERRVENLVLDGEARFQGQRRRPE